MTGGSGRRENLSLPTAPVIIAAVCGSEREALSLAPVTSAAAAGPYSDHMKILTVAMGRRAASGAAEILGFTPEYILPGVLRHRQPEPMHLGRIAHAVAPLLEELQPDVVAVAGDSWVPAAVALIGGYRGYSIAHVGAGVRRLPYSPPRGRSRRVPLKRPKAADVYADYEGLPPAHRSLHRRLLASSSYLHMAPTAPAAANLIKEGVPPEAVHVTGHPFMDAMELLRRELDPGGVTAAVGAGSRTPLVVSMEQPAAPETVIGVCRAVRRVVRRYPHLLAVFELPRCKISARLVTRYLGDEISAVIVPPLGCLQRWSLLGRSVCAITTGGPLEEEGPYFGVPVLVAADATDRPELAELGFTAIVGTDGRRLEAKMAAVFGRGYSRRPRGDTPPGGRLRGDTPPGGRLRGDAAGDPIQRSGSPGAGADRFHRAGASGGNPETGAGSSSPGRSQPRSGGGRRWSFGADRRHGPLTPGEAGGRHPYGDGEASRRILQAVLHSRGLAPKPAPFAHIGRS